MKFYYNGIKTSDRQGLQKCHYSKGNYTAASGLSPEVITIYNREYTRFSAEIQAAFMVQNNSEMMTDYFEKDRIRIDQAHPMYALVNAAWEKQEAHNAKRQAKYMARIAA